METGCCSVCGDIDGSPFNPESPLAIQDAIKTVKVGDQMRQEIHAVIKRYGDESDVTVYQTLGVLHIVMGDIERMLEGIDR